MDVLVITLTMFGLLVWGAKKLEEKIHRRPGTDFQKLRDVPLSAEQWKKFCALAYAKGVSQKRLLAEAVLYYLEQKIK